MFNQISVERKIAYSLGGSFAYLPKKVQFKNCGVSPRSHLFHFTLLSVDKERIPRTPNCPYTTTLILCPHIYLVDTCPLYRCLICQKDRST
jgi:hypothetical protein